MSTAKLKLDGLFVADSTHYLACSHCIGPNRSNYRMKCTIIKTMGDGRLKVVVFGERNWKNRGYIKQVKYVDAHRVTLQAKSKK